MVLNCDCGRDCGCVTITAVAGVADATMRIAVAAIVNFFYVAQNTQYVYINVITVKYI